MMSGKTNVRSGRTPSFVLVALLVLLAFLSYGYWGLSSKNSELEADLDTLQVQKKDIESKNAETEKNLENIKEELHSVQGNHELTLKQVTDLETELTKTKSELTIMKSNAEKYQIELGQCDSTLGEQRNAFDALRNEKAEIDKLLNEERQKHTVCDVAGCISPVRGILTVVARIVSSEALVKILNESGLDGGKLMEGIQGPPQQQQQPQAVQNPPQQQANDSQEKGNIEMKDIKYAKEDTNDHHKNPIETVMERKLNKGDTNDQYQNHIKMKDSKYDNGDLNEQHLMRKEAAELVFQSERGGAVKDASNHIDNLEKYHKDREGKEVLNYRDLARTPSKDRVDEKVGSKEVDEYNDGNSSKINRQHNERGN